MSDLSIAYAVKRSRTGLGLFAVDRIPKGKRIIEYKGRLVPNNEVEASSKKYFFELNSRASVDGSARNNLARYINHSCRPNAEALISRGRIWIWAARIIAPSEEITYDYGKEYFEAIIKPMGCRCRRCAR